MRRVIVVDYNPDWPRQFQELRATLAKAVGETALAIEHVGSTAVPGLRAKPVIDIDVVVEGTDGVNEAINKLALIGYKHRGDLGVTGREAFDNPHSTLRHNLYVCQNGSLGLRNHLAIRDALRSNPEMAARYGELKTDLARRFPHDIDKYIEGKTDFLLDILERTDFPMTEIDSIRKANQAGEV